MQTARRAIPRVMTAATTGMVAITVALTVFAGPIFQLCEQIGTALLEPVHLVQLEQAQSPDAPDGLPPEATP